MARVSPSRSLSFEFSGVILVVSILGAEVTTCGHHTCWFDFSSETVTSRESSARSGVVRAGRREIRREVPRGEQRRSGESLAGTFDRRER